MVLATSAWTSTKKDNPTPFTILQPSIHKYFTLSHIWNFNLIQITLFVFISPLMPEMWFRGFDMYEGVDQTVIRTSWRMVLVGVAVGLVVSSLLVFTLYRQRWYIRCLSILIFLHLDLWSSLRYHLLRKKVNREGPFAYDAFISYAKEDENWVMVSAMRTVWTMVIDYGISSIFYIGYKFD